jgi:hypothetical protein
MAPSSRVIALTPTLTVALTATLTAATVAKVFIFLVVTSSYIISGSLK